MQVIPLSGDLELVALVDDEDFEWLSAFRWRPQAAGRPGRKPSFRAVRSAPRGRGVILMHRELLSAPAGVIVDHRNGNPLDNQRANLRLCTHAQNAANRQLLVANKSSRFKGVTWSKRMSRWQAGIKVDGRFLYLGLFEDEEEAADAYARAAQEHYGEFAYTNKGAA